MNHLLLGASIPFLTAVLIYAIRGFRASIIGLIVTPIFMSMTMFWAVAPDLPRLFGLANLYNQLSLDPRCNIFFWHYDIDLVETDSVIYPVLFILLWALLLIAAWRELMLREKESHG